MDPNHVHEFNPSRKGCCKTIIGSRICGGVATDEVHTRFKPDQALFEEFEVRESEDYDGLFVHFPGRRATEGLRQFVEDAIREKLEGL
jgi:hypothetical protein